MTLGEIKLKSVALTNLMEHPVKCQKKNHRPLIKQRSNAAHATLVLFINLLM